MHKLARNAISVADIFPGSSALSQHTFLKEECQREIARKGRKTSTNINLVSKDTFNFILGRIRHNLRGTVTEDPTPPAFRLATCHQSLQPTPTRAARRENLYTKQPCL